MTAPALPPDAARADRIFFRWVFPALLIGIFLVYGTFRQRYIGATDWYGYYQQAELLKTGSVYLPTALPPGEFPAIVPLGYMPIGVHAVPLYTPGFPLLLAAASFVKLTFFVPPLVGLASCLLIFFLIRDFTDRWTAAVFTLAWAFLPIVVFGSTTLMSDLVAATALMGAYFAYRRGQLLLSAWILGYGFSVRPTNVLFLAVLVVLLLRDRRLIRYGLYLLGPVLLYSLYNYKIYGSPFRTGYADFRTDLVAAVFPQHFGFYLWFTLAQFTPVLIGLALWGLRPFSREKLFLVLWFAALLVFYSFWLSGGDRWWWTRFLLPAYPALFVLAACGFSRLRERWHQTAINPPWRDRRIVVLFAAVALLPLWEIGFGWRQKDLWQLHKGHGYYDIVEHVAALVPADSYVGSVEFSGSFHVYTQITGFVSMMDSATNVAREGLRQKRPVYLLVEPWNLDLPAVHQLQRQFTAVKIAEISQEGWGKLPLYRLTLPAPAVLPASR